MVRCVTTAVFIGILLTALGIFIFQTESGYAAANYAWIKFRGNYTVADRIRMHAGAVEQRLKSKFIAAEARYPPVQLAYVAFKDTAQLEVYARDEAGASWRWVHTYPILGMSGGLGPKLYEGDKQVPEGIYRAEFLNANSRYHLSIRLSYPNEFDKVQAQMQGWIQLGSDIMIHGTTASIGCLAMGNQAAEDLFILAAIAGKEHVEIVVATHRFSIPTNECIGGRSNLVT